MEDLVKTAGLYYEKSSLDIQEAADNFFYVLDNDKDGKVNLREFLSFMRQQGHVKLRSSRFFKELDKDGKGLLEFKEVMAIYYIIKSGRPFCSGCGNFIPGMYFTCSKCFENGKNLFCVCPHCFKDEAYDHEHITLIDNYALLEAKRIQVIATCSNQHKPSLSLTIVEDDAPYEPTPPSSSLTITEDLTSTTNDDAPYEPTLPSSSVIAEYRTSTSIDYEPRPQWLNLPHKAAEAVVIAGALKALDLLVDSAGANCTIM